MTEAVRGVNITVRFGSRAVLRGVTLSAKANEVVGVLGPSGAGKSTLFGVLAGEHSEHEGSVFLGEEEVTQVPTFLRVRRGLGYVPQLPSVLFDLTVEENLSTFLQLARRDRSRARGLAEEVLLGDRRTTRAGDLSGGERRRLELARALVTEPRVLLCDEPFAGIDPAAAKTIGALLADAASRGAAVILADHHVDEALSVCTRALLLLDGEVRVDASPEAFRDHELVRTRYLGTLAPGLRVES